MHERNKYFYTVLFLDDYFPGKQTVKPEGDYQVELPKIRSFEITKDSDSSELKWIDANTLHVRHGLPLPLTLEMWNEEGKPIFYVPLLKEGIDSISVGQVVIESSSAITLYFNEENPPPQEGETFKLSMKTLPHFDTKNDRLVNVSDAKKTLEAFEDIIDVDKTGLAIVFRRNSLEAHTDLEVEFDEMYLHSLTDSHDLRYLTDRSKFQKVKWLTLYTDNLQEVLDQINNRRYEIKFSWEHQGALADDPYGYQIKRGHFREHRPGFDWEWRPHHRPW